MNSFQLSGAARCILLAGALLSCSGVAGAQQPGTSRPMYTQETWTVGEGLPINSITSLARTPDGYLWIGTTDGLARFDGVRFTFFNAGNTPTIPSNRFASLHVDRRGTLWAVTEQFHLLQYRDGRFTHIDSSRGLDGRALRLQEDSGGEILVTTTRGVGVMRAGRYQPLVADRHLLAPSSVAVRRRDGSVWYAGEKGIRTIGGAVSARPRLPVALQSALVQLLAVDKRDRLWVSAESGVWVMDGDSTREVRSSGQPITGALAFLAAATGDTVYVSSSTAVFRMTGRTVEPIMRSAIAETLRPTMAVDGSGAVWFALGNALFRNGVRANRDGARAGDDRAAQLINAVLVDDDGSVWLGTRGAGLQRLRPSLVTVVSVPEGLPTGNIYPLYEDPWGAIWIGTFVKGPSRIEAGQTRPQNFGTSRDLPALPRSFVSDRPDRLWMAALDGIYVCTIPIVRCRRDPSTGSPTTRDFHALHLDAQGHLWAGSMLGVLRHTGTAWEPVRGLPEGVGEVRGFVNAPDGALWMATGSGGVVRYDGTRFQRVSTAEGLPGNVVRALYVDRDGWLWVGTEGRGLGRLDPRAWSDSTRSRRIARLSTDQGLFDAGIHAIVADDADHLWMSTNRGIFRVARAELLAVAEGRARTVRSTSFTDRDGMRNREANGGMQWPALRARDGRLWFATQDGVVILDPRRLNTVRRSLPLVVERLVVSDSAIVPAGGAVSLGVNQRDMRIEFTALALDDPRNVRFRYRLDPYDRDWVDAGARRSADYTRVPPGRYTFRVQGATPNRAWSDPGASLTVDVAYQVWETLAFRVSLALLMLGAAGYAAVAWSRTVRRRAEALERIVDERTATLRERELQLTGQNEQLAALDRAKSRFFANVSHEFRTPLMLTIGPLEDAQRSLSDLDDTGDSAGRSVDMALRNSRRLLRLVNQILDVARLEAGELRLRRVPLDLAQFTRTLIEAFVPVAQARRQRLDVDAPKSLHGAFDADAIEKIITNLISNAIKFTPAGGRVAITLLETDAGVRLQVTDTGPGIAAQHLPHVFERFYQIDDALTRAEPGTGIGLALVKELSVLHGGAVSVSSGGSGLGATFTVELPLEYPDAVVTDQSAPFLARTTIDLPSLALSPLELHGHEGFDTDASPGDDPSDVPTLPTLLIADDSADLRTYLRAHFAERFRVLEAADGAEALDIARRELPDIVVSDLMMPNVDGHALVRALRADPETEYLPVVLLTAHTALDERLAGLAGGADDYVTKPFEMRELVARVDNLIALRRRLLSRYVGEAAPAEAASIGSTEPTSDADTLFAGKLRDAINARLADPEFGVAELAHDVAMDRTHLFRRARQVLGLSPSDVIRNARLDRAAQMLADRSLTVSNVAYGVGFNSVSHFTRSFQSKFGATPSAFRAGVLQR